MRDYEDLQYLSLSSTINPEDTSHPSPLIVPSSAQPSFPMDPPSPQPLYLVNPPPAQLSNQNQTSQSPDFHDWFRQSRTLVMHHIQSAQNAHLEAQDTHPVSEDSYKAYLDLILSYLQLGCHALVTFVHTMPALDPTDRVEDLESLQDDFGEYCRALARREGMVRAAGDAFRLEAAQASKESRGKAGCDRVDPDTAGNDEVDGDKADDGEAEPAGAGHSNTQV